MGIPLSSTSVITSYPQLTHFPQGILGAGNLRGFPALVHFLNDWKRPVDIVVVEKYVIWGSSRGKKANIGTTPVAVKGIGAIENFCIVNNVPLHLEYDSNMCALQALKTGLDPKKLGSHNETHWAYAANHGRMYLIEQGLAKENIELNPIRIDPARREVSADEAYERLFKK